MGVMRSRWDESRDAWPGHHYVVSAYQTLPHPGMRTEMLDLVIIMYLPTKLCLILAGCFLVSFVSFLSLPFHTQVGVYCLNWPQQCYCKGEVVFARYFCKSWFAWLCCGVVMSGTENQCFIRPHLPACCSWDVKLKYAQRFIHIYNCLFLVLKTLFYLCLFIYLFIYCIILFYSFIFCLEN